jgi:hypothetical protein
MKLGLLKNERALLFLAIFFVFIAFASIGRFGTNPSSRFMLTKDLVLYHQLNLSKQDVDFYSGLDYSIKDGKYFSDKPPGFSFLTIPLYVAGDYLYKIGVSLPRTDSFNYDGDANAFFLIVVFVVLFNAFGSVKFFDTLRILDFSKKASLITTLIFSFGTLFFVYSYNLFLHSFVASLLIFTTYYFLKGRKKDLILSGVFFGFTILCEYTIILIAPLFVFYLLRSKNFKRNIFYFSIPIVFELGLLGLYNLFAFGSPFIFSYMISTFVDTQKFDHPMLQGLYELLISNWRGLFLYNPVFLLSIFGFFLMQKKYKKESFLFLFPFLIYLFFYCTYRYLSGGLAYGPRHLVSIFPFLGFLLAPCLDKRFYGQVQKIAKHERIYFCIAFVLIAISFFFTFLGIYVTPEAAPEIDLNPVYNYSWKSFLEGSKNSFLQTHYLLLYFILLVLAVVILIKLFKQEAK